MSQVSEYRLSAFDGCQRKKHNLVNFGNSFRISKQQFSKIRWKWAKLSKWRNDEETANEIHRKHQKSLEAICQNDFYRGFFYSQQSNFWAKNEFWKQQKVILYVKISILVSMKYR